MFEDFLKVDIRVGRIVDVAEFPEAKKPAYILKVDFGSEVGVKQSSAQITKNYSKQDLLNTLVLALVSVTPRQVGPFVSEVLVLGVYDSHGGVWLINPGGPVPLGSKLC